MGCGDMKCPETECPIQGDCGDYESDTELSCVHWDADNGTCHHQYDTELWELEEESEEEEEG